MANAIPSFWLERRIRLHCRPGMDGNYCSHQFSNWWQPYASGIWRFRLFESRMSIRKGNPHVRIPIFWSECRDSNPRPLGPEPSAMRYIGLRLPPRTQITGDGKRLDSTNFLMLLTQLLYHKIGGNASKICERAHGFVRFFLALCAMCASRKGADLRPLH